MPAGMNFEFGFSSPSASGSRRRDPANPLRILVLADLSGRRGRGEGAGGAADLAARPTVRVDLDTLDDVIERYRPTVRLTDDGPGGGLDEEIVFRTLDDFHPDALAARLTPFERLRALRTNLSNPSTFAAAAAELGAPTTPPAPPATADPSPEGSAFESLLGGAVGTPTGGASPSEAAPGSAERFVRGLVDPAHFVAEAAPELPQLLSVVDDLSRTILRRVLHDPHVQAIEATWRGVARLVDTLESEDRIVIRLLDVTRDELVEDVRAHAEDLESSGLHHQLVDRAAGAADGEPWSIIIGDETYGAAGSDVAVLAALGALAGRGGACFLGAADPSLLTDAPLTDAVEPAAWKGLPADAAARWHALRTSSFAPWIGLALPRMLLRRPYGAKSEPIDTFAFEELTGGDEHDRYLWGNPAFGCTTLLGRSFLEAGWSMEPGDQLDLEDLPVHSYTDRDGDVAMKPCAEVGLSERAGTAILERGLIPLLSYRNRNAVRVMRFQSIASPPTALGGPWA